MSQVDLWGNEVTVFTTARERYGTWPTTVWPVDHSDTLTRELKSAIGDVGKAGDGIETQTRVGSFRKLVEDKSVYGGKVGVSVFSPLVTQWVLNIFAPPPPAQIFDPFGGGGTRAIMSAASGYSYLGVEIRAEETEAVRHRIEAAGQEGNALVITGDSRKQHVPNHWADFLITCPPYFDLEKYRGPVGDLSMANTYDEFLGDLDVVVARTLHALKPGALACWVIGLHRDKAGSLLPLHHDLAGIHRQQGFTFREEVVLSQINNGALQRVGNFEKGNNRLIRTHEYLMVFQTPRPGLIF